MLSTALTATECQEYLTDSDMRNVQGTMRVSAAAECLLLTQCRLQLVKYCHLHQHTASQSSAHCLINVSSDAGHCN